jgi:hypothetical protein
VAVLFENPNTTKLKNIIGDNVLLVIDEAKRIANIGIKSFLKTNFNIFPNPCYYNCILEYKPTLSIGN